MKVKVKGRNQIHEVELPEGFRRVFRGTLCPGDLFLNVLLIEDGITQFEPVEEEHIGKNHNSIGNGAEWYGLIIRRGDSCPDKTCERCEVEPARTGYRFCWYCIKPAIEEARDKCPS